MTARPPRDPPRRPGSAHRRDGNRLVGVYRPTKWLLPAVLTALVLAVVIGSLLR
ncbi:MAG: hypothetical protein ABIS86_05130 [Streptosporangiaceae bacterium]